MKRASHYPACFDEYSTQRLPLLEFMAALDGAWRSAQLRKGFEYEEVDHPSRDSLRVKLVRHDRDRRYSEKITYVIPDKQDVDAESGDMTWSLRSHRHYKVVDAAVDSQDLLAIQVGEAIETRLRAVKVEGYGQLWTVDKKAHDVLAKASESIRRGREVVASMLEEE